MISHNLLRLVGAAAATFSNMNIRCSAFLSGTRTRPVGIPVRAVEIDDRRRGVRSSHPHGRPSSHKTLRDFDWILAGKGQDTEERENSSDGDGDGGIDLSFAMANARANLAAGTSPGAGLESAFDQADAAFADLIVTSVDSQGVDLDDEDVEELAKGGSMDKTSTSKKSKGLFGDMSDVLGALGGGAHIVKREDGTL